MVYLVYSWCFLTRRDLALSLHQYRDCLTWWCDHISADLSGLDSLFHHVEATLRGDFDVMGEDQYTVIVGEVVTT